MRRIDLQQKFEDHLADYEQEVDGLNIYNERVIDEFTYNDEIDPHEEAFMKGYIEAA